MDYPATIEFLLAPTFGILIGTILLVRYWFDRGIKSGGLILSFLAVLLILSPRVVSAILGKDGFTIQLRDKQVQLAESTLAAIDALAGRIEAIEVSLKTLPNPKVDRTSTGGGVSWSFDSSSSSPQPEAEWCKILPSLCTPDGNKLRIEGDQGFSWDAILNTPSKEIALQKSVQDIKKTLDSLREGTF